MISSGLEPTVDPGDIARLVRRDVIGVRSRSAEEGSTHALERVAVDVGGESPLDLVLKGTRATRPGARPVRPRLVRDEGRERWAYTHLLDPIEIHSPRFYGVLDPGTDRERLVLEAIPGHPLTEEGDRAAWASAARTLATFHRWGISRSAMSPGSRLLRQSSDLHRRWWERAVRRTEARGGRDEAARLRALRPGYLEAVARLARTPGGLVHGEFYPSNLIVEGQPPRWRVRPVDWESVGVGPLMLDLAALTAGDWGPDERSELCEAYLSLHPVASHRSVRSGLEAARMVNAMQWLGWSVRWQPPPEHARDWLVEAEDAAGAL